MKFMKINCTITLYVFFSKTETLMHLLKGSLGSGLFCMPYAFAMTGFTTGIILTILTCIITTYGMYVLVYSAHRLQYINHVPMYSYNDCFAAALLIGPECYKKLSKAGSIMVDILLVIDLFGCCVVYTVICGQNVKRIVDEVVTDKNNSFYERDERIYMCLAFPFAIGLACVRYLKYLAPFSGVANIAMAICLCILYYFYFEELHSVSQVQDFKTPERWPIFFSVTVFSLEAIGVVMPLENNMKNGREFIQKPWIMLIGMVTVSILYTFTGIAGYLRFGAACDGSVTLNFPPGM